jgi:peptidoglycan/xylan/chitin deacetylase (PgdA/CDA1 family)
MNQVTRIIARIAKGSGIVGVARSTSNIFQARRRASGKLAFPYVQKRKSNSIQILSYHRINDEHDPFFPALPVQTFAKQMEYVAERYYVLRLDDAVNVLKDGDIPDNSLVITFDDGYRDNYLNAFPILQKFRIPATIFLATGAINSTHGLWHDRVFSAFRDTNVEKFARFGNLPKNDYAFSTLKQKRDVLKDVLNFMWTLSEDAREDAMRALLQELEVEDHHCTDELMLRWEDIQVMAEHDITFGSHTVTHPILSRLPLCRARAEIQESKETIQGSLKRAVRHFAYPVGRCEHFSNAIKGTLREAGYVSAVTTIPGSNHKGCDLYELHRSTPWDLDIDAFALRLAYFKFAS